jgi:hypothetical protein
MLVVADGWSDNLEAPEQLMGLAGVFGGDQERFAQYRQRTQGYIL